MPQGSDVATGAEAVITVTWRTPTAASILSTDARTARKRRRRDVGGGTTTTTTTTRRHPVRSRNCSCRHPAARIFVGGGRAVNLVAYIAQSIFLARTGGRT